MVWAHKEAKKREITNMTATCSLMRELGETVHFSKGSEKNFKITTIEDIDLFKAILHSNRDNWLK
jgi:2-C-methyl-D-erythritol 4-phosphate cytidylyltransferase